MHQWVSPLIWIVLCPYQKTYIIRDKDVDVLLTWQLNVFDVLHVSHGIIQDLCCADDHVWVLHHFPEEVLLLALPTDRHHVVLTAQVRLELFGVMLVYKVNLQRRENAPHFIAPVLVFASGFCPSSVVCISCTLLTKTTTFAFAVVSRCLLATYTAARVFPPPVGSQIMVFSPRRARWTTSSW